MVEVSIFKSNYGYESIKAVNHSEDPIICASISTIMWGLAGSLMNLKDVIHISEMVLNPGNFFIEISPMFEEADQVVVDTLFMFAEISLRQVSEKYPQFLSIIPS